APVCGFAFLVDQVVISAIPDESAIGDQFIEHRFILLVQLRHVSPLPTRYIPGGNVGVDRRLAFAHLPLQRTGHCQRKTESQKINTPTYSLSHSSPNVFQIPARFSSRRYDARMK